MGRRKRRKIVKGSNPIEEEGEPITFNKKKLQIDIVKEIPIRRFCTIFCGSWARSMILQWDNTSDQGKVRKVLSCSSKKPKGRYHPLYKAMKEVSHEKLLNIYKKRVANRHLTREVLVEEILYKFFGEESPLDKRVLEKSNLSEVANMEQMFRFIVLSGVTFPSELLKVIFSYIQRNFDMIVRIGGVNQHFYLTVLSTWPHVSIQKSNLYKISLLVLKSIESVTINDYKLLGSDKDYLWKNVDWSRLRSIRIDSWRDHRSIFTNLQRYCKKNDVTPSITSIEIFRRGMTTMYCSFDQLRVKFEYFPRLRSVEGLTNLPVTASQLRKVSFWDVPSCSPHEIKNQKNENVDCVSFDQVRLDSFFTRNKDFKKIIELVFINLTEIRISFHQIASYRGLFNREKPKPSSTKVTEEFNFDVFSSAKNLKKLFLDRNRSGASYLSYEEKENLPVVYNTINLKLDELSILPFGSSRGEKGFNGIGSTLKAGIFDFNFMDFVSSNLLTTMFTLKEFRGRMCFKPKKTGRICKEQEVNETIDLFSGFVENQMLKDYRVFDLEVAKGSDYLKMTYESLFRRMKLRYDAQLEFSSRFPNDCKKLFSRIIERSIGVCAKKNGLDVILLDFEDCSNSVSTMKHVRKKISENENMKGFYFDEVMKGFVRKSIL